MKTPFVLFLRINHSNTRVENVEMENYTLFKNPGPASPAC